MNEPVVERYAISRGGHSEFTLKTAPSVECRIYEGHIEPSNSISGDPMYLYADGNGFVQFDGTHLGEHDTPIRITLTWASNGKASCRHLELIPKAESSGAALTCGVDEAPPDLQPPGAIYEAGLTSEEVSTVSPTQLIRRGFPPKPDRRDAPEAYEA